jgi:hypothetical protein
MKVGRGQRILVVILGLLLFGNLPRVLRDSAESLRTRGSRRGRTTKEDVTGETKEKSESKGKEKE